LDVVTARVVVDGASRNFVPLHGSCEPTTATPGSYRVSVGALDYVVCASGAGK
jgi:hypothetical protein